MKKRLLTNSPHVKSAFLTGSHLTSNEGGLVEGGRESVENVFVEGSDEETALVVAFSLTLAELVIPLALVSVADDLGDDGSRDLGPFCSRK